MSEGYAKAREVAQKIRTEQEQKQTSIEAEKENIKSQLAKLSENPILARMYTESAQIGASNLGGELPQLKVHAVGRSSNELSDGTEPKDGAFFYKPTLEQFDSIDCHILSVSRGFRAAGLEGNKDVFNQIVGGVMGAEHEYKPFIMYFTGLKLSYLWEFGKEAGKYTRAKPVPLPMFALTVRLTTEKISNNYGKSWIVKFQILKNEDNFPVVVLDPGEFQFLKDSVEMIEDTIEKMVQSKTVKPELEEVVKLQEVPSQLGKDEDIPF